MIDLRLGDFRTALADLRCNAILTDPPYGERTHRGHNAGEQQVRTATGQATRRALTYEHWTDADVHEFVMWGAGVCTGWIGAMTSTDLVPTYRDAFENAGMFSFAPVPIIQKRPRLLGDGPASWAVYLMVARPRAREFMSWGCLPGAYFASVEKGGLFAGAKPLDLMRQIVRDYSRPGDLVCDPCAGGATTLLAALWEGRRAVGAEVSPETHAAASRRLAESAIPARPLFEQTSAEQADLWEV